jgi:hypothetical protein
MKLLFVILTSYFSLFISEAFACKRVPVDVSVEISESKTVIDNSKSNLPNRFGEIEANFKSIYILKTESIDGCLILTGVEASMGYDFDIRIDVKYKPKTCEYDAILGHETDHRTTYQSILSDTEDKINLSLKSAANGINPVKIGDKNIATIIDGMLENIKNYPEFKMIFREMDIESDIRNRRIDAGFDYMDNCK